MRSPSATNTAVVLAVDRVACTGHGICVSLLPEHVTLDEWGYPSWPRPSSTPMGHVAIRLCPARALT